MARKNQKIAAKKQDAAVAQESAATQQAAVAQKAAAPIVHPQAKLREVYNELVDEVNILKAYNLHTIVEPAEIMLDTGFLEREIYRARREGQMIVSSSRWEQNVPSLHMVARAAFNISERKLKIVGRLESVMSDENGVYTDVVRWSDGSTSSLEEAGITLPFESTPEKVLIDGFVIDVPEKGWRSLYTVAALPENVRERPEHLVMVERWPIMKTEAGQFRPFSRSYTWGRPAPDGIEKTFYRHNRQLIVTGGNVAFCVCLPDETVQLLQEDKELLEARLEVLKAKEQRREDIGKYYDRVGEYLDTHNVGLFDPKKRRYMAVGGYPALELALLWGGIWLIDPQAWVVHCLCNKLAAMEYAEREDKPYHKAIAEVLIRNGVWQGFENPEA